MQIKFISIKIQGFAAIHDEIKFKLDRPGFNIIQARNGSGKTTIISALCWAIWGQPLKEGSSIGTWERYRLKTYKGTKVEVLFRLGDKKYKVIRCKDYKGVVEETKTKGANQLFILEDGKWLSNLRDKGDVKTFLPTLLGYSLDLFKNSVVFGQKVKRIMGEKGPEQKKILEEAFEVMYINKAHAQEKKKQSEGVHKLYQEITTLTSLTDSYQKTKELVQLAKEKKGLFESYKQSKLEKLEEDYKKGIDKLGELKKQLKKCKGVNQDIQELQDKLAKYDNIQNEANSLENREFRLKNLIDSQIVAIERKTQEMQSLSRLFKEKSKACPECGQPVSDAKASELQSKRKQNYNILKAEIAQDNIDLKEKQDQHTNLLVDIGLRKEKLKEASFIKTRLSTLQKSYSNPNILKKQVESLEEELSELITTKNKAHEEKNPHKVKPYIQRRMELKDKIKAQEQVVSKAKREQEILDWLVNDPLSNKGLKAYIFSTMLSAINERLKFYAKYIGFRANIFIDMKSANKNVEIQIYLGDDRVNADDLSGGQSQLIDIAITFSIHDVVVKTKACNILFMDEVFESLDKENVELVTQLIKVKSRGLSLFLITHLPGFQVTNANITRMALDSNKHTVFI